MLREKCRAGEPEPELGVFGSLEPEPLEKKTRSWSPSRSRLEKKSGAGAAKKLAGSPALCTCIKRYFKLFMAIWLNENYEK